MHPQFVCIGAELRSITARLLHYESFAAITGSLKSWAPSVAKWQTDYNAVLAMWPAYTTLKALHVGSVATSLLLFVLRGIWMLRAPEQLGRRWVRIVPHVVDTALLASAIALAAIIGSDAWAGGWLTAKVIGLIVYIVLGSVALKYGPTRFIRSAAFAGALATFGYIVMVAVTKSPTGPF